ncbi:MAG: carbohydrate-binding family 9-like protein [Verrucomicrobiota bacterium]|nr:carbohydrate-binding family 9-like protein [Verrucomicrobiota bacterium]
MAQTNSPPTHQARWIPKNPKIDGFAEPVCWKDIAPLSALVLPHAQGTSSHPTEVHLAYTDTHLYCFVKAYEKNMAGIVTNTVKHDGPVYDDDCVELFIDPGQTKSTYYQFAVNAVGTRLDAYDTPEIQKLTPFSEWLKGIWAFNGEWQSATTQGSNYWTCEIGIPWKTIGVTNVSTNLTFGFEFARLRKQNSSEWSQWSPTYGWNHKVDRYGTLTLSGPQLKK